MIRGIDPAQEEKVIPLRKFIKLGKLDLEGDSTVLGVDLAQKLGVTVGDKLTVYSPGNLGEILDKLKARPKKGSGKGQGSRRPARSRASQRADRDRHFRDRPIPPRLRSSCSCRSSSGRNSTAWATLCTGSRSRRSIPMTSTGSRPDREISQAARLRRDLDRDEPTIFRRGPAGADCHGFPALLYRDRRGFRHLQHAHYRHGAETARDRHHESRRRAISGKSWASFFSRESSLASLALLQDSGLA